MLNRKQLKQYAASILSANYWPIVGVCFLLTALTSAASISANFPAKDLQHLSLFRVSFDSIFSILLQPPLSVGLSMYCLRRWRGEEATLEGAFVDGFSNYGHVLGGYLWMMLFTALWSLLFVIPGIVKSLSYAMTPYLLGDCKQVSATDALKLSMRMMMGHKWELFLLHLSFLGWTLLTALTAGLLGIFYVGPYYHLTLAGYYAVRKHEALADGTITEGELSGDPID